MKGLNREDMKLRSLWDDECNLKRMNTQEFQRFRELKRQMHVCNCPSPYLKDYLGRFRCFVGLKETQKILKC